MISTVSPLRSAYRNGTIKPFTILAGLETGALAEGERIQCEWRSHACLHSHGSIDAREAIAVSCGSFAASVADRVGLARVSEVARDFGLGASTDLGLRFEVAGHLADPERTDVRALEMEAAVGSNVVAVTPLQLALAYAAIANGGTLWRPRLTTDRAPLARRHVHASAAHLALVRDGLERAVSEEGSSAYAAYGERIRIAGKMGHGHATDSDEVLATWFAGYAPAEDPTLAIVVVMDGSRGVRPARVAVDIVERYLAPRE